MVLSAMDTWILLRGLTRQAAHWGRFADDFRRAWPEAQVVTLDLPGNGPFHARPSPPSVPDMVTCCRAELARQDVRPPFRLFPISLGAMVATEWARSAPEDIGGCVLVNTSFRPFSPFFTGCAHATTRPCSTWRCCPGRPGVSSARSGG
jgi:pimeloyl-ACP methyl ester carboxylesterase